MKHANCGGNLKSTHGAGNYRCEKCKERIGIGTLQSKRPSKSQTGSPRPNLDVYDGVVPR